MINCLERSRNVFVLFKYGRLSNRSIFSIGPTAAKPIKQWPRIIERELTGCGKFIGVVSIVRKHHKG